MKFCGGCGAPQVPGDQFCQRCGRAYSADEATQAAKEPPGVQSNPTPVSAPVSRWPDPVDEPVPSWATGAAVGAVLLAPFISLIVALVMRSSETRPSRRAFLKSWAIWSGSWLCTGFLLFAIVACSALAGGGAFGGGCKGGPELYGIPSYTQQSGSTHWTAIVPCTGGGSKSRPATKSEERWLNH